MTAERITVEDLYVLALGATSVAVYNSVTLVATGVLLGWDFGIIVDVSNVIYLIPWTSFTEIRFTIGTKSYKAPTMA